MNTCVAVIRALEKKFGSKSFADLAEVKCEFSIKYCLNLGY